MEKRGGTVAAVSTDPPEDSRRVVARNSLAFPILSDPKEIFNLLLGKPATLIKYDIPKFEMEFTYSQFFPIFGPLGASINGTIGMEIDFHAVGFDTLGIQQFIEGGFKNPLLIFNGFAINRCGPSV